MGAQLCSYVDARERVMQLSSQTDWCRPNLALRFFMGIRKVDPKDWLNWGNLGDTLFQIPARRAEARSGGQSRRRRSFSSTSQVFRFLVLSGSPLRSFQAVSAQIISRHNPAGQEPTQLSF
jgi:hypothetical protein